MASNLRKTGINIVGDMPWGTHFCCFYETTHDLLALLGPYFATGLALGEFCVWVISDPLTEEDALRTLRHLLPDLDQHLAEHSIEIIALNEWYLKDGAFDLHRVIASWNEKLDHAMARGYPGMRVSGNTAGIRKKDWQNFREYEKELDHLIANQRMIVLCTYPLTACRAADILDVAQLHQVAVARRSGKWESVETPELKQAKQEIQRLNAELEQRVSERTSELVATTAALRREIAERQQAEDRLRLIIDTIPAMVFTALPDGSVDYVNRRWLHYMGLSLEDVEGWNWDVPIHPEDRSRSIDHWRSTMAAGQSAENELRVRRADGVYRWILGRFVPLGDEIGNIVKWYGASTDIDDRRRAEALLHAREQEFRAIVENAPDHIIRYDRDFRRTYANPAVAQTYGLPAEAVIDQPIGSVIQDAGLEVKADELAQVRQRIADVFDTGTSHEYEMSWPTPRGRRYYSVHLFPERDLNGSVTHVLSIARDITERKHAEDGLRQQKLILQKIFDHIPVMIAFVGQNGRVELVNRAWERILGWTLHELEEQQLDIYALAYPDPQYRQQVLDFVAAATGEWIDLKVRVRDGSVIDITVAIINLTDGTSLVIARDITERKQVEAERSHLYEQMQSLSHQLLQVQESERRAIARELHDEIGQRLTGLGMLLSTNQQLPPEQNQARQAQAQAIIGDLIEQVRNLALDLRPAILDDFGLVPALVWLFERYTMQTHVAVRFEHSELEEQRFAPDVETTAYRIVQEALTNVARHARVVEVTVRLWIDVDMLAVMVADQGRGFDPQANRTRLSMGLAGMTERAALLGGELTIESAAGVGTRVTAILPLATGDESPPQEYQ